MGILAELELESSWRIGKGHVDLGSYPNADILTADGKLSQSSLYQHLGIGHSPSLVLIEGHVVGRVLLLVL